MKEQFNSNQTPESRPENPFDLEAIREQLSDYPVEDISAAFQHLPERDRTKAMSYNLNLQTIDVYDGNWELNKYGEFMFEEKNLILTIFEPRDVDRDNDGIPGIDGDWHNGVCPMERRH